MLQTTFVKQLKIKYPMIQAPMAGGVTTSKLVAEAARAGALGMIGAGYLSATSLRTQIQEIKRKTENPFGVNLFVPCPFEQDALAVQHAKQKMASFYQQFAIDGSEIILPTEENAQKTYQEQLAVLLKEKIPVCSFTFGIPSKADIQQLQANGTTVIGTATTVEEAQLIEKSGMDMIVVQGSEAGGHRGTFHGPYENGLIGLFALLPQVVDQTTLPVIAAGGIMDGRGLAAALCLGAEAVQMGTAFLLTEESGAHPLHQQMILQHTENQTILTEAFSGKLARGLENAFTKAMQDVEVPPFPIQNTLTQGLRKAAKGKANHEYMSLWSGQALRLGRQQTVGQLIERTVVEAKSIIK
jgi:nitronate monooxygenase